MLRNERIRLRTGLVLTLGLLLLAATAYAADDTARFEGTWKTTFAYNRQLVTMLSVHDATGYKTYIVTPTGNTLAAQGSYSAVNGKWTASAPAPNNAGLYHFLGDNTVVCVNAVGQTLTWRKQNRIRSGVAGGPTAPNQPPGGNGPPPAQPAPQPRKSHATPPDDLPPSNNPATLRGFAAMKQRDYNTAWREFMTGAQQQDAAAETAIGAMLFNHMNPPGTGYYAQCEQWLLAAAKQGDAEGMYFLGRYYYESGRNIAGGINPGHNTAPIPPALQAQAEQKFRQSREWLEKSAALGNQQAMGNLAILVDAGLGGPADPDRAKELRAEAERGPDKAFGKKVAGMDSENEKIQAAWQSGHYADAMRDAQTRANQGNPSAQALLCKAYYEGVGIQRNYATALTWCNRAVAQKNADAMFILGLMYEHGAGVNQDIPRSVKLFDQAASLGQSYARMEVKGMRMQGEANRTAAMSHGGVEETACGVAGGVSVGPECVRGGATIDPFDATKQ